MRLYLIFSLCALATAIAVAGCDQSNTCGDTSATGCKYVEWRDVAATTACPAVCVLHPSNRQLGSEWTCQFDLAPELDVTDMRSDRVQWRVYSWGTCCVQIGSAQTHYSPANECSSYVIGDAGSAIGLDDVSWIDDTIVALYVGPDEWLVLLTASLCRSEPCVVALHSNHGVVALADLIGGEEWRIGSDVGFQLEKATLRLFGIDWDRAPVSHAVAQLAKHAELQLVLE